MYVYCVLSTQMLCTVNTNELTRFSVHNVEEHQEKELDENNQDILEYLESKMGKKLTCAAV